MFELMGKKIITILRSIFCFVSIPAVSDRSKKGKHHVEVVVDEDEEKKSVWVTTLPNGDRMQYKDNTAKELKPIMICLASDPETNQVGTVEL